MRKSLSALAVAFVLSVYAIPAQAIQCVPYAREVSGLDLKGDAWMWWSAAAGRYDRGRKPQTSSILVFSRQGKMRYGHVAVVTDVVHSRMLLVDHANWAPARTSGRGKITRSVPVLDVSAKNDWSKVRVWYEPAGDFGDKIYRADGFIYNPNRRSAKSKISLQAAALQRAAAIMPADFNPVWLQEIATEQPSQAAAAAQAEVAAESAPRTDVAAESAPRTDVAAESAPKTDVAAESAPKTDVAAESAPRTDVAAESAPRTDVAAQRSASVEAPARATESASAATAASPSTDIHLGAAVAVAKVAFKPRGSFLFN